MTGECCFLIVLLTLYSEIITRVLEHHECFHIELCAPISCYVNELPNNKQPLYILGKLLKIIFIIKI